MSKPHTKIATSASALKSAHSDFAATFSAFKEANDARLSELEAKHSADTLTHDKVERINAALDAQQKSIERLSLAISQPALGSDSENNEAKSAWTDFMRTGDGGALRALEGKSLSVSVGADGGYIAPAETETTIGRALQESSPFRRIATVRQVSSGSYKKPVSLGGATSGWAGESTARPETSSPQLDLLEFPVGELYAMPAATQTLLDDAIADVDAWLADEVRDVFAAQETAAFIHGDGINKPYGLLSNGIQAESAHAWGNLGYVATGTDGDFDATAPIDALLELIYAPKTRYRPGASFIMNRKTVGQIRRFKDADGNYIWQPSTQAGDPSQLLGYPLVEVEDMPNVASDSYAIAFGDFRRGYMIVDRQGVQVIRDPYSNKPYVLFYTTKRVGGGVQDFNAIKLLKFGVS